MKRLERLFLVGFLLAASATPLAAEPLPKRIGACSDTRVKDVGPRLEGVEGSGSGIGYENGGAQISYDTVAPLRASRPGDVVRLCLVSIPKGCPRGDSRGRVYRATNKRTGGTWEVADSDHRCGGA